MFNQTEVFQGLGTLAIGVSEDGIYTVDVKSTIPTLINGGGASSLTITIKNGSTTKYSGDAGQQGAWTQFPCSAGDTINVVFASAAAPDESLNAIKSTIAVYNGV